MMKQKRDLYCFKPFQIVKCSARYEYPVPKPRSGHRIVCDESNIYVFGGYNPENLRGPPGTNVLFKEIWVYNFATRTWVVVYPPNMPNELASSAVILRGSTMIIFGGTGYPFGAVSGSEVHVCNVRDNFNITAITAEGSVPPKLYGQALVLDGRRLYTVGGTTGHEFTTDIHCLDLKTKVWEEVYVYSANARSPEGRYRHELAFDGTRIYVLGGGTVDTTFGFKDIDAFNIVTKKWEIVSTKCDSRVRPPGYPPPRQFHGCVQLPEEGLQEPAVFICGGYGNSHSFRDIWKLSLKTLQWTYVRECSFPQTLYFHSSAITPYGCMYTFGGVTRDNKRINDLYATWVCIPKLEEMCWEAILHYNPDLYLTAKDKLLSYGFPRKFVGRL
ncbi:kelch domain-containing protein 10 [Schistocerca piceifrons]|uniref:kelch domain-containing protein 10 n=1 Tax=Schistocerca piceifrons TaxID=274613 RepID=UPI001F5F88D6|nr:kelch domain-containing protein 10 [Schistocerca piceifrons]